jgi:hypothetical protein
MPLLAALATLPGQNKQEFAASKSAVLDYIASLTAPTPAAEAA